MMYICAKCKAHACRTGEMEKFPQNCPCREVETQNEVQEDYKDCENYKIAYNAALVESENYCKMTRIEETMEFANKCGYKKLGLAFCFGLRKEAEILTKIFESNGFLMESVICKNGSVPKEFLGLKDENKLRPGAFEAMCNPIGQAELLNKQKTELNVLLGLCVGHDSLFIKYSNAPITVIAVKDRVLGHNPLAALYLSDGYYKNKLYK